MSYVLERRVLDGWHVFTCKIDGSLTSSCLAHDFVTVGSVVSVAYSRAGRDKDLEEESPAPVADRSVAGEIDVELQLLIRRNIGRVIGVR